MKTPKAAQTRARIYEAALALFAAKGYEHTTMRLIADAAGTSLGLTYRYFRRKDEIVLELYRRTTAELEARVGSLPAGTVGDRLQAALELKIALCAPHREVFAAVVPMTLSPQSEAFALGKDSIDIRAAVVRAYAAVIRDSTDADGLPSVENAALLCFVLQLAILFYWLHDTSEAQARTHALVALVKDSLHLGLGLLMLPDADDAVHRLADLLRPLFGS